MSKEYDPLESLRRRIEEHKDECRELLEVEIATLTADRDRLADENARLREALEAIEGVDPTSFAYNNMPPESMWSATVRKVKFIAANALAGNGGE